MKRSTLRLVFKHFYNCACAYKHEVTVLKHVKVAARHSSVFVSSVIFIFEGSSMMLVSDTLKVHDDVIQLRGSALETVYPYSCSLKGMAIQD